MPRSAGHVRRDGAGSIINIHHEPLHIDHIDIEAAPSIKKEEAKTMERYKEITGIMQQAPSMNPADDFVMKVMNKISFQKQYFTINPFAAIIAGATKSECFLYIMLAALFNIGLALTLHIGFRGIGSYLPMFVNIQPIVLSIFAAWLIVTSLVFGLCDNNAVLKMTKRATLFYIMVATMNGAELILKNSIPGFIIYLSVYSIVTVSVGIFLALVINKHIETYG